MKRRWFVVLGCFLLVGQTAVLAAFGVPRLSDAGPVATLVVVALAGVLFVLGGIDRQFGEVEWYQFVGAGNLLLGLAFVLGIVLPIVGGTSAYESSIQPLVALLAIGGGASIMFIGVDWVRGGRHFDPSTYDSGPIFATGK